MVWSVANPIDELSPEEAAAHNAGPNHQKAQDFQQYNWNIFRYIADYLHLAGVILLIFTLLKNRHCHGLSLKTQILYFVIFICRYLDLFDHQQATYLVFFKLTYIGCSALTLVLFWKFSNDDKYAYEVDKDTAPLPAMIIPCFIAALILPKEKSLLEIAWAFSEYLEGFSMVPQYVFCYRESLAAFDREMLVLYYIMALGGYRVFYAFNWMYKAWNVPGYSDPQSWLGGFIEIAFFIDFLSYFVFQKFSVLRGMVLTVDDKVNEVVEKVGVELKVFNRATNFEPTTLGGGGEMRQRKVGKQEEYEGVPTKEMAEDV